MRFELVRVTLCLHSGRPLDANHITFDYVRFRRDRSKMWKRVRHPVVFASRRTDKCASVMVLDYDVRVARHRLARKCILYLAALHEPFAEPKGMCGKDSNAHGAV